ncbi:hypothetical protein GCM10007874_61250 [Labrys miyagiensis]|uniref:Uncharacterized protein n=1 Tax=Labrys miyagiensis TaxID=346912 RepID=A0ABQ6CSK9_9HYPH|nr:hypothetical protein [Labrys miyagiensis]GLS23105.1 hypothetical protein GCM10007874_61250 [Labrys miyagiensis]
MANVELIKVEQRRNGHLLFNVRMQTAAGRMELPTAIEDQGSSALNEAAVLRSTLAFAEGLAAAVRSKLRGG